MEALSKVIVFELGKEQYGVNLQQVLSIERLQDITRVPQTSSFTKGVMNLRGKIIPVIDLKERLKIGKTEKTDATRVLIVQIDTIKVGLIVDTATDVADLDPSEVEPTPSVIGGVTQEYLTGVAKLENRLLILLNLERVLKVDEKKEIQEVGEN